MRPLQQCCNAGLLRSDGLVPVTPLGALWWPRSPSPAEYAFRVDVADRSVAAGLRLMSRARLGELCGVLTVEALEEEIEEDGLGAPPSRARIEEAFSRAGSRGKFDPGMLVTAVLRRTIDDVIAVARANADGYVHAADTVRRGGGPEALAAAIAADLSHDLAGETAASIQARERAYYRGSAVSDREASVAWAFRELYGRAQDVYRDAYSAFLTVMHRRLATGVTYDVLHLAISGYLEGVELYRRWGVPIDDETVFAQVMRVFWSHTTPIAGDERDSIAELWAGVDRFAED